MFSELIKGKVEAGWLRLAALAAIGCLLLDSQARAPTFFPVEPMFAIARRPIRSQ